MRKTVSKLKYLIVVMIAVLLSVLFCGMTVYAEEQAGGISVAQITDLHYYPTQMSYKETKADYNLSAFKKKSAIEMKLLAESSANLRATLEAVALSNPDYLVVTGDITSDGERQGLIDVANALRTLQNKVRAEAGNDNFQILVVAGNHDISNPNATDYSSFDGSPTSNVDRASFSKIFAGLGFPDMTESEASSFYSNDELNPNENDKYLPYNVQNGSKFVESKTSSNVKITHYKTIDDMQSYGSLSYIMESPDMTVLGLDTVLSTGIADGDGLLSHEVGGELSYNVQDWIASYMKTNKVKNIISIMHHNLNEHYALQEELMTDYVLNNYEQAREFLLDYNVKYNFSGHVHANDVASFVNYDGKTIYDVTTASIVGSSPSYRVSNVKFNDNGSSDLHTTINKLGKVDYTALVDNQYLLEMSGSDVSGGGVIASAYDYSQQKIHKDMLEKTLYQVVSKRGFDSLKSKLFDLIDSIPDTGWGSDTIDGIVHSVKKNAPTLFENFISKVNSDVLADYEYNGDNVELQGDDNKLLAIVYEMSYELMNIRVAKVRSEVYDMQDLLLFAYSEYINGGEAMDISTTPEWFQEAIDNLKSGEIVSELQDVLYDEYYPFIKKLLSTNMDLSSGIDEAAVEDINTLFGLISSGQSVKSINLDVLITAALDFAKIDIDGSVSEEIDNQLANFMTKSSILKISDFITDISLSMAIDTSHDGIYGESKHIKFKDSDTMSHSDKPRADIVPSVADGRLPSMISVGFGNDPVSTKEIVWFTDKSVKGSDIQFMVGSSVEDFNAKSAINQSGSAGLYAYDYSLLEIPLFATSRTKEISRHSISLSNLNVNESYLYRIGDAKSGYWSPVYLMKTAPDKQFEPFEVLLMSDMNGSTSRNYNDINKVINGVSSVFENGYDFIINLGDNVNSSSNLNQWRMALDTSGAFQNTSTVSLGGQTDSDQFEYSKTDGYYPSQDVIKEYNNFNLHFNTPSVTEKANYYSFDYCGVHFTVLDTNDMVNNRLSLEQETWIKNDLSSSTATNKVVLMNRGIYTASKSSYDQATINLRESLTSIFSKNGVDIVLQSGDHVYSESNFLDSAGNQIGSGYYPGNSIANNNGGVLYVGIGTIGDDYGVYTENEDVDIYRGKVYQSPRMENPTFGKLTYDGESISYKGYVYNLDKDKITTIIDTVPWWAIVILVVTSVMILFVIGLTVTFILYNKGKIEIKFLRNIQIKRVNKKASKTAIDDGLDVANEEENAPQKELLVNADEASDIIDEKID